MDEGLAARAGSTAAFGDDWGWNLFGSCLDLTDFRRSEDCSLGFKAVALVCVSDFEIVN